MDTLSGVAELDRRFGILGVASVREGNGAIPRVQITSPLGEGEMYLHGAQVTSWKTAGSDEVLFLSAKSRWTDGQAIRGGIPICFPWFRAKVNDPQAPHMGSYVQELGSSNPFSNKMPRSSSAWLRRAMSIPGAGGQESSDSFIALLSALN
jgi:hypothetical protein